MKINRAAPAYTRTTNVELGAALSVLGIEIKLDHSVDKLSGQAWKTLLIGLDSVPFEAIGATNADGEAPMPSHNTQLVLGLLKKGMLQEKDPTHPALDVLRACKAADALRLWCKGTEHVLTKVKGVERWALVPGQIPPSLKSGTALFGTRDLKLAACLCVLGFPIARLEGNAPDTLFCFQGQSLTMPPAVASDLAQAVRTQRLQSESPEHPLLWMMQGLLNRDAIGEMMRSRAPLVLIRAPGTGRASLVSANAKGRTMDRVKRHLRIP
jgi:hypothetical protein